MWFINYTLLCTHNGIGLKRQKRPRLQQLGSGALESRFWEYILCDSDNIRLEHRDHEVGASELHVDCFR